MSDTTTLDELAKRRTRKSKQSRGERNATADRADMEAVVDRLRGRYVFLAGLNRWYDTATNTMLDKAAVDTMHRHELGRTASATLLEWSAVELLQNLTWLPNGPAFVELDNGRYLNAYRPPTEAPVAGSVELYLELVEYLIPDAEPREIILDWIAYQVQHPEVKTNWQLLIGGQEGIGKDALFYPLRRALGSHNVTVVDPVDLDSQFNDWVAHRKLAIINEMLSFRNQRQENLLKKYAAAPPDDIPINPKGAARYTVPNLLAMVAMTNHRAQGMTLSRTDRRWFAYWCPAKPAPEGYYPELWAYLEGDGALHVWHWLMQRDLSGFRPKAPAPATAYKQELAEVSEDPVFAMLRERHEDQAPPFDKDLLLLDRVLSFIDDSRVDRGRVGGYLRELGCRNERLVRKVEGRSVTKRFWIVRRHHEYDTMPPEKLYMELLSLEGL